MKGKRRKSWHRSMAPHPRRLRSWQASTETYSVNLPGFDDRAALELASYGRLEREAQ
jgi:hypothetical protein